MSDKTLVNTFTAYNLHIQYMRELHVMKVFTSAPSNGKLYSKNSVVLHTEQKSRIIMLRPCVRLQQRVIAQDAAPSQYFSLARFSVQ